MVFIIVTNSTSLGPSFFRHIYTIFVWQTGGLVYRWNEYLQEINCQVHVMNHGQEDLQPIRCLFLSEHTFLVTNLITSYIFLDVSWRLSRDRNSNYMSDEILIRCLKKGGDITPCYIFIEHSKQRYTYPTFDEWSKHKETIIVNNYNISSIMAEQISACQPFIFPWLAMSPQQLSTKRGIFCILLITMYVLLSITILSEIAFWWCPTKNKGYQ
jgi:hypothetical protein